MNPRKYWNRFRGRVLQPIWQRLIGMRLAQWFDHRHPEKCWADICTDMGLGNKIFRRYDRFPCGDRLTTDADHDAPTGTVTLCWCGKMAEDVKQEETTHA